MFISIIFLPLIGSVMAGTFANHLGRKGAVIITCFCMLLTTLASFYAFYEIGLLNNNYFLTLGTWIKTESLQIHWGFLFDSLTVTMLLVVTIVSTLVHIYSYGYMEYEPHLPRFMSYLSLFTFFMVILVTSDNFIQLFLGWEGVGLCSYLLINFWFTRVQANKSALKALLVNRVGDCGLLLGILTIFYVFKTTDFTTVFSLVPFFENQTFWIYGFEVNVITAICLFLFIGSVGKSAQLGLHTWLPDAMEGPTPVSALIHAATMVTAGVFLIIRSSIIFEYSETALLFVSLVGAVTAFFAATIGVFQNDIKKIIAYSTCSQLGYMVFVCGLSNYQLALFHLANHAFFKALLFLSAGSVIHALSNEQDIRKMGGLRKLLPFTYSMFLIGSLALTGFPFLSGFYSKDAILEIAFSNYSIQGTFCYWLGSLSAGLTAFYSFRLLYFVFLTDNNSFKYQIKNIHESNLVMLFPLCVLAVGSIFSGFIGRDLMIGLGSDFFTNSIYVKPTHLRIVDSEFLPVIIKLLPTVLSLLASMFSIALNDLYKTKLIEFKLKNHAVYSFFNKKWYIDYIYNYFFVNKSLEAGYKVYKNIDKGILEIFGPMGISSIIYKLSFFQLKKHNGLIYQYACLLLFGILFFLFVIEIKSLFFQC